MASPGPSLVAAGRGAREHAPEPVNNQANGAELAVAWKARDPLADSQLLMPLPRDLPCRGAFQEPFDGGKSLLAGRADFDRDCELGKRIVHGWASRLLPNVLGCRQAKSIEPAAMPRIDSELSA